MYSFRLLAKRLAPAAALAFLALHLPAHAFDAVSAREAPSYGQRNGELEALSDIAAGRPLKLYSHVFDGRIPGFSTPGLLNCSPAFSRPAEGRILFAPLPEADWREGIAYTAEQGRAADAARRFARLYNRTIFQARMSEIRRTCPQVRLVE